LRVFSGTRELAALGVGEVETGGDAGTRSCSVEGVSAEAAELKGDVISVVEGVRGNGEDLLSSNPDFEGLELVPCRGSDEKGVEDDGGDDASWDKAAEA